MLGTLDTGLKRHLDTKGAFDVLRLMVGRSLVAQQGFNSWLTDVDGKLA